MPGKPKASVGLALLATALGLAIGAPAASAADATYEGASADASVVVFSSTDRLVTGDTDSREDVFERSRDASVEDEFVTRIVSVGPTGGNQAHHANFTGVSGDGVRIFFTTQERLVPADGDQARDIYMRNLNANTTTLVSQGATSCSASGCGNAPIDVIAVAGGGIAAGGQRIFFRTVEALSSLDTDTALDVYMRQIPTAGAASTTLVSQGAASCAGSGCGNAALPASLSHVSDDGTKAVLTSSEGLATGDVDGLTDIYARDLTAGTTMLVSVAGACSTTTCNPSYGGASNDGSHVFFETTAAIAPTDLDTSSDVYDWAGGVLQLVSSGPDGGNAPIHVTYAGASADGAAVYFQTTEPLDEDADEDTALDVYRRQGGATALISTGSPGPDQALPADFSWASPDGSSSTVIFTTAEPLTADDEDTAQDVYSRNGTTTTLLSAGDPSCAADDCGDGVLDAEFTRASSDGSHVFFGTDERLVANEPLQKGDTDSSHDVYQRFGGVTKLITTGPLNGNGEHDAGLAAASQDGSLALFTTKERLTADDDFANENDVFSASAAGTLLVSVENDPSLKLGPAPPTLEGTDPASPGASTTPSILGQADPETEVKIYTTSDCSGEQAAGPGGEAAGGGGAELADPGIPVSVAPGSTTSFYATAEAEGVVSGCAGPIQYIQSTQSPPPGPEPGPDPNPGTGTEADPGTGGGGGSTPGGTSTKPPKTHSGGVEYVVPETRITFGPSFKTRRRTAVFRFLDASGQPGTRFICKIDRRSWRSCGSPQKVKGLARGKHAFKVKAVNAVGVWQPSPATHRFKVVAG
jgi:hypothetical protein